MNPIWGSSLHKVVQKGQHNGDIWYLCSPHSFNLEIVSTNPTNMQVFKTCALHIILLILCLSLAIDNLPMTRSWKIFGSDLYPIMLVCTSISDQLFCNIKILSLRVHFDFRPSFVIVSNLCHISVFKYTTTYHAYSFIVVFSHFPETDLLVQSKRSRIILYHPFSKLS